MYVDVTFPLYNSQLALEILKDNFINVSLACQHSWVDGKLDCTACKGQGNTLPQFAILCKKHFKWSGDQSFLM